MAPRDAASASSTARFLSALRRFYQYLNREKLRSDDPTAIIGLPLIRLTDFLYTVGAL